MMIRTTAAKIRIFMSNAGHRFKFRLRRFAGSKKNQGLADLDDIELIRNNGERVTHLHANDTYTAHLAIYDFALPFCRGLDVLDAGSGSGYGSAYLAEHGAKRVAAIELDEYAVEFSQQNFGQIPNLAFQKMSLDKMHGFQENEFDVIFSSNVLEHVPDVHAFFAEATRILKPSGKLILAVPPIDMLERIINNLGNHYHINIWSQKQWLHTLQQYFDEIAPYSHMYIGKQPLKPGNKPEESKITVADFEFKEYPVSADRIPTMTAMFIASQPKKQLVNIDKKIIDSSFNVNLPEPVKYDNRGILCTDVLYTTLDTVGRLDAGIRFCQTFVCNQKNLCGLVLHIATYHKRIDSTLKFTLVDEQRNTIREVEKSTLEIPDNSFYPFMFPAIDNSKGKTYTFCIETIASKGDAVTLWADKRIRNACTRNGTRVKLGLVYKCCFRPVPE